MAWEPTPPRFDSFDRGLSMPHIKHRVSRDEGARIIRETRSQEDKVNKAAVLVHDAIHGRNMHHRMDPVALRINKILRNPVYVTLFLLIIVLDLSLAIVELPSTFTPCNDTNSSVLPTGTIVLLELVCLSVFVVDIVLRYRYMGQARFAKFIWGWVKLAFVLMALVNVLSFWVSDQECVRGDLDGRGGGRGSRYGVLRLHRMMRPMMIVAHFRNVQKIFGNMVATVGKVARVSVLLLFHVVFSGAMAYRLFGGYVSDSYDHLSQCDTKSDRFSSNDEWCSPFARNCRDYFGTLGGSMNQLFILLTTANYPDVMMPAYDCHKWAAAFFVVFLMIGLFFIMNLILAVAYSLFQDKTKEKTLETIVKRVDALDASFDMLTSEKVWRGEAGINYGEFCAIMTRVRSDLEPWHLKLMFDVLDDTASGLISKGAWRELVHIVEVRITPKGQQLESFSNARLKVHSLVTHKWFNPFFDLLVYINGVLVLIEFGADDDASFDGLLDKTLLVLLYVFVLEVALKLVGLGVKGFFGDGFNVLDFVVVGASIVFEVATAFDLTGNLHININFLRTLRLIRALRALKGFGEILRTFASIVPTFFRYLTCGFCVFYAFAILGMECFAGVITPEMRHVKPFNQTAYSQADYWNNNFDTLGRSLTTLFELTIVNNWPIIMEGYTHVTSRWAMLFFYLWFFVIVVVVLNIVTAFLIDDFTVMRAQISDEAAGIVPEWMARIQRIAAEQSIDGHENWSVKRPVHTINTYESMFSADIDEYLGQLGLATPEIGSLAARASTTSNADSIAPSVTGGSPQLGRRVSTATPTRSTSTAGDDGAAGAGGGSTRDAGWFFQASSKGAAQSVAIERQTSRQASMAGDLHIGHTSTRHGSSSSYFGSTLPGGVHGHVRALAQRRHPLGNATPRDRSGTGASHLSAAARRESSTEGFAIDTQTSGRSTESRGSLNAPFLGGSGRRRSRDRDSDGDSGGARL